MFGMAIEDNGEVGGSVNIVSLPFCGPYLGKSEGLKLGTGGGGGGTGATNILCDPY